MTSAVASTTWPISTMTAEFAGPVLAGLLACQHADERFGSGEGLRQAGVQVVAHARRLGVRYLTAATPVGERLIAAALLSRAAAGMRAPVWGRATEPTLLVDGHVGSALGVDVAAGRLLQAGTPAVHALVWSLSDGPLAGDVSSLASLTVLGHTSH